MTAPRAGAGDLNPRPAPPVRSVALDQEPSIRLSRSLFSTQRHRPAGTHSPGQAALVQAGLVQELGPGTYVLGPLALRVIARFEAALRAELGTLAPEEVSAPLLLPADAVTAGLSSTAIELRDRRGTAWRLDPTALPALLAYVDDRVTSYRQLPVRTISIGRRPRDTGGGPRARVGSLESVVLEVLCADAEGGAALGTGGTLRAAGAATAARCGLDLIVADDVDGATRFVAPAPAGGAVVAASTDRSYAAMPAAARADLTPPPAGEPAPMRRVETPGARTIAELQGHLPDVPPARMLKTMLYCTDDGGVVAALARGDRGIDEHKLRHHLGVDEVALADPVTIEEITGAEPGFAGPVGLPGSVRIVADLSVADLAGVACGANDTDVHLVDVWFGRDLPLPELADLDAVRAGDAALGGGDIELLAGIDVGAVSVSGPLGVEHVTDGGERRAAHLSTLRVDLTCVLLALAEQHVRDGGLRWPLGIAPFPVAVIQVRSGEAGHTDLARRLVGELSAVGIDALWDDRDARIGVKFNDAELVGIPIRVVVGRDADDGRVEVRWPEDERGGTVLDAAEAIARISERITTER